ncbi:hypothetical protein OIDMADRAFT_20530 [Oidiodendron maius Zn]|uniref:Uncharacterized protein n=1 Tax=Oidiodendron maius (strain Zn) TaxID=913774 RepID=A0A0C3GMH8_OIDMZ|nr:hypothetical protein OIDMADRAFT_20530 [Oidiodendron maius Zn]
MNISFNLRPFATFTPPLRDNKLKSFMSLRTSWHYMRVDDLCIVAWLLDRLKPLINISCDEGAPISLTSIKFHDIRRGGEGSFPYYLEGDILWGSQLRGCCQSLLI